VNEGNVAAKERREHREGDSCPQITQKEPDGALLRNPLTLALSPTGGEGDFLRRIPSRSGVSTRGVCTLAWRSGDRAAGCRPSTSGRMAFPRGVFPHGQGATGICDDHPDIRHRDRYPRTKELQSERAGNRPLGLAWARLRPLRLALERLWGIFFYFVKNEAEWPRDVFGEAPNTTPVAGAVPKGGRYAAGPCGLPPDRRYTERRNFFRLFPPFPPFSAFERSFFMREILTHPPSQGLRRAGRSQGLQRSDAKRRRADAQVTQVTQGDARRRKSDAGFVANQRVAWAASPSVTCGYFCSQAKQGRMRSGGDVFGGAPNTTPMAGVVPVAVCRTVS
jgi:hypothetical protein